MNTLNEIRKVCKSYQKYTDAESAILEILSLLDENGVGVSDSSKEHGDLPHVRKRDASGETDTIGDESEQIALGKIIDSDSFCFCGKRAFYHYYFEGLDESVHRCKDHPAKKKES